MRMHIAGFMLAALGLMASSAMAQSGAAAIVGTGPGVAGGAQTVEITATVTAIDAATRAVTLKGPQGREVTVTAGPEVKNFAQMKTGDQVKVKYVESLALELKKGSTAPVSRVEDGTTGVAKPGERPGAVAGRRLTIVAEITELDAATQMATLRGPKQTVALKVNDPAQFKMLAKGDRVVATYTEAMAIEVQPVK